MRHTEEEIIALMLNKNGIHHLPKVEFKKIMRQRPYDKVAGKKLVFIDLKYWISFRILFENEAGSTSIPPDQQAFFERIYQQLLLLTENEKIACVVSDSILTEVEKMSLEKRLTTARIMDKLRVTVVLNGLNACSFEYINLDRITAGKEPIANYHLSSPFEANRFLAAVTLEKADSEADLVYNLLYDSMSGMTIEEYLKETSGDFHDSSDMFAKMMNETKEKDTSVHTFNELLIQGLVSQIKPLQKILNYSPVGNVEPEKQLSLYRNHAPFLYLHSAIHAAINIEKSRKVNSNDFYDLFHSCIGVGYADYFFTEKKFHHLLRSKPIDCTSYYKCEIYSDPKEIHDTLLKLSEG